MSYILDALRKADAQRSGDPARGIHAQPATTIGGRIAGDRRRQDLLWMAVAAAILGAALWSWMGAGTGTSPAATGPAQVSAVGIRGVPAPTPVLPATVVVPPAPEPPPPATAVVPPAPGPAVIDVVPKASARVPPVAAPPAGPTVATAQVAAAPAAERTYSLAELPPDVQQALPKFSVSGGVYSANVAQRMLVVNGEVFNEGSEIASGVVLEQIGPRVALLKFRGLRISQPY